MSRIPGIANFDRAAAPLMSTLIMAAGRRELRDCAMGCSIHSQTPLSQITRLAQRSAMGKKAALRAGTDHSLAMVALDPFESSAVSPHCRTTARPDCAANDCPLRDDIWRASADEPRSHPQELDTDAPPDH
jgi:hypothetical protein